MAASLGLPDLGKTPPAFAFASGTPELTPAESLIFLQRMGEGLTGRAAKAQPHVIAAVRLLQADGRLRREASRPLAAPGPALAWNPHVRGFAGAVLSATSDPGGTLAALGPAKARLGGGLYAKTGTHSREGATLGLHIAGIAMAGGRPWTFLVRIVAPDSRTPLGERLNAGQFAKLAETVLARIPAYVGTARPPQRQAFSKDQGP